ncbi:MAG: undecaprenyl-phosphate glucose phosphotransferase [Zetaproteobacteria bacterium CG1_02_49_23]|nr:MAG: undecaprenyl-phosphate glucose phosphotransferase [Zetaproteobacteria bacterium CG1_02_49_23]
MKSESKKSSDGAHHPIHFRNKLQSSGKVSIKLQLLLDIAIVEGALFLCVEIRHIFDTSIYNYLAAIVPIFMWLGYFNSGVYRRHSGKTSMAMSLTWAWSKVLMMLVVLAFVTKVSEDYSRPVIVAWYFLAMAAQIGAHIVIDMVKTQYISHEKIPSILVGNSELGGHLATHINHNPWMYHKIVGVVSDDAELSWYEKDLPKLGSIADLRSVVEKHKARRVYFALPMRNAHQIRDLQLDLVDLNVDVVWAPDFYGLHTVSPSVREVAGVPLYFLSESPIVGGARISKMLMDKSLAFITLILCFPIMLAVAVAIKLSSPGPILYRQERHGLDGKIIKVLKFRSMVVHEEKEGTVTQARKNDSRVTRIGRFIRRTSIDELPQLINVLKGEMSLVGPRPHAKEHNEYFAGKIEAYMSRHRILPGMTGLAQINGCRGETDTIAKMRKRVEYDMTYIVTIQPFR